jgi:putative ABC transport system permease protein
MEIIYGVLEQGLIYGLVGIAVFLTLRVIDFPDMGINNSFASGAAAWYWGTKVGFDPYSASVIAFLIGFIIGYITASLHLFFNIRPLLAGIIIMIALYSVNMRLMGRPNIPLMNTPNIFGSNDNQVKIIILFSIIITFWIGLSWFLMSEIGLGIRISGQNYMLGETYGISKVFSVATTMAISNGIIGFAGALLSQSQGFIDINMGNGLIVSGLVSVIIGEKILSTTKVYLMIIMSVIGAIIYKIAVMFALFSSDIGLQSSDVHSITALMMVAMMFKKKSFSL